MVEISVIFKDRSNLADKRRKSREILLTGMLVAGRASNAPAGEGETVNKQDPHQLA